MLRVGLLFIASTVLGQVIPAGCPLGAPTDDGNTTERGTITTSATAAEAAEYTDIVLLGATATSDVDGGAVSYYWIQTEGPGVRITNATQANARFVAPSVAEDTTLRFLVTTTNERGDVGQAEVAILIMADPDFGANDDADANNPIARAGTDKTVAGGTEFTLDGTNSRGTSLTYLWSQATGRTATIDDAEVAQVTITAPAFIEDGSDSDNVLEFQLEVVDVIGRRDTDRVRVTLRKPTAADETDPSPRVLIKTSMGDITVELNREKAPKSVNNFLDYVDEGFYDGLIFHRVIDGFVIQGGGFTPDLEAQETNDPIENEADNGLDNDRGTIAMARTSDPDSATSQFYINLEDNNDLNYSSSNAGYAVFGRVIEGMSVVDAIGAVATGSRDGFNDVPVEDVIIETIERIASDTTSP